MILLWLHHQTYRRSVEGLRHQPDAERSRSARTERLPLMELLYLLWDDLNQLLNLLELCRDDLKQLLKMYELLLLKQLQLLKLLRQDLQQLQKLWQGLIREWLKIRLYTPRLQSRSLSDSRSESPSGRWHWISRRGSDSKRASCDVTHQIEPPQRIGVGLHRVRNTTLWESRRSRFRVDLSALRLSVASCADERRTLYLVVREVHELAADIVERFERV